MLRASPVAVQCEQSAEKHAKHWAEELEKLKSSQEEVKVKVEALNKREAAVRNEWVCLCPSRH